MFKIAMIFCMAFSTPFYAMDTRTLPGGNAVDAVAVHRALTRVVVDNTELSRVECDSAMSGQSILVEHGVLRGSWSGNNMPQLKSAEPPCTAYVQLAQTALHATNIARVEVRNARVGHVTADSNAQVTLTNVQEEDLTIEVRDGAIVKARGNVHNLTLHLCNRGIYKGSRLSVEKAHVFADKKSKATLHAACVRVKAKDHSVVWYVGEPRVEELSCKGSSLFVKKTWHKE